MGRRVQLQEVRDEARQAVARLARARTAPARAVERAQVVQAARAGAAVAEIAVRLRRARNPVSRWRHRCAARGLAGREDAPRGGRPPTSTREPRGAISATARTRPPSRGLAFQSWTLDRLVASLAEAKGITIKRSRLDAVVLREGWRWRQDETGFGERVAAEVAAKSGSLRRSRPNGGASNAGRLSPRRE